jgi:hypothetical protein
MSDRYAKYKLGLGLDEKPWPAGAIDVDVDYEPDGMLELDTRPISGDELQGWRHQTRGPKPRHRCQKEYMSQREIAERMGVPESIWRLWEHRGIPNTPAWCALIREFFADDITVEYEPSTPEMVKGLANLVGGMHVLGDELGVGHEAVRLWVYREGAPVMGGGGPLVRWLVDELEVDEADSVHRMRWKCQLTRSEVKEIRRRYDAGDESVASIAEDFDASYQTVYAAARRQTYEWVEEAS